MEQHEGASFLEKHQFNLSEQGSPRFIYLLGAPGSGKGTQGQRLASHFKVPQIAMGEMLREIRTNGGELAVQLAQWMDQGQLVPDEMVFALIRKRLEEADCKRGAVFDGFPRTLVQAQGLDQLLQQFSTQPLQVIVIDVSDAELEDRLSGRMVCARCHRSYHRVHYPPRMQGVCDVCQENLITRSDDMPETVSRRLRVYHQQTVPLINYYRRRGGFAHVDGTGSTDAVFSRILNALQQTKTTEGGG